MDKFIGFDIDHKHTVACVVQAGQPDRYRKLPTDVGQPLVRSPRQPRCTNGGGTPNRRMRSRIAANKSRGTATSTIWNITYFACRTTFAPILISFSRSVVNDPCFTDLGSANRRRKFPRFYASANSRSRACLSLNFQHDRRVHFTAYLPSLIHCSAVPRPW